MANRYEIATLTPGDVMRSFAIMQVVVPSLDLATWKSLTATEQQRRQWAAAKDGNGYIRGLIRMTPMKHLELGDLFDVPVFATISLIDEAGVSRELIEFTRRLAEEEGCQTVRLWRSAPERPDFLDVVSEPPEG
ncbi:hypothetical protein ABID21_004290 [Pseudorhizobium tarimense]|uniref:Uncharacterized protein n=1 Tax=Pseudorhizobium tarimense TaxID=1079109 RepID=A0ABV2HD78_9HYPH|nr:GNAT family N-acetyltransferase [Pseudorhizobium tarimense]MCJ8521186.1 GNAT family N-acetyltransferase [Pseudorhizobium tarimense]